MQHHCSFPRSLCAVVGCLLLALGVPAHAELIIDDFEAGLPAGSTGDAPLGFTTFSGGGATGIGLSTTMFAPPRPGAAAGNSSMQVDAVSENFTGFVHTFENAALDTWVSQDWSGYTGFSFWLYGQGTGTGLFIDILDNRSAAEFGYDAEIFSIDFADDFSGWQKISISFADLARKEIGNGAPDDGLGLTEVHGWAFGLLATDGPVTYWIDDFALEGPRAVPEPGTLALFGLGLAALGFARRKIAA